MIKKLVVSTVFFVALCFAGVGCLTTGALYYDGPYKNGNELFYYYEGAFYTYQGGGYVLHHYVPQDLRKEYEEQYRKNREQYTRDYPNWRSQHPEHPRATWK